MYSVSFGVAIGIMLGIVKLIFDFSILYILIPGYVLGVILTYLSTEEFVNVGWDSAGVTTGPVTVPLVLAMALVSERPWALLRASGFWLRHRSAPLSLSWPWVFTCSGRLSVRTQGHGRG